MAGYFHKPANHLQSFFELGEGVELTLRADSFAKFAPTLRSMVKEMACDCVVSRVYAADLPEKHSLRIFRVYRHQ